MVYVEAVKEHGTMRWFLRTFDLKVLMRDGTRRMLDARDPFSTVCTGHDIMGFATEDEARRWCMANEYGVVSDTTML